MPPRTRTSGSTRRTRGRAPGTVGARRVLRDPDRRGGPAGGGPAGSGTSADGGTSARSPLGGTCRDGDGVRPDCRADLRAGSRHPHPDVVQRARSRRPSCRARPACRGCSTWCAGAGAADEHPGRQDARGTRQGVRSGGTAGRRGQHPAGRPAAAGARTWLLRPAPDGRCPADGAHARPSRAGRGLPGPDPAGDPEDAVRDSHAEAAREVRGGARARLRLQPAGQGALPGQHVPTARLGRGRLPAHPVRDQAPRGPRRTAGGGELRCCRAASSS